jgi:hypothetical protein
MIRNPIDAVCTEIGRLCDVGELDETIECFRQAIRKRLHPIAQLRDVVAEQIEAAIRLEPGVLVLYSVVSQGGSQQDYRI